MEALDAWVTFIAIWNNEVACFRLSDSGKDAKVKALCKVGEKFPPILFSCSLFLNPCQPDYLRAWNRLLV